MPRYTDVIDYKDMQNYFNKCQDEYWKHIAIGLYYTGCRAGELVQIKVEDITKEQAFDPEFSIDFLAKNLAKGNGKIWTCFSKMKST